MIRNDVTVLTFSSDLIVVTIRFFFLQKKSDNISNDKEWNITCACIVACIFSLQLALLS